MMLKEVFRRAVGYFIIQNILWLKICNRPLRYSFFIHNAKEVGEVEFGTFLGAQAFENQSFTKKHGVLRMLLVVDV